MTTVVAGVVALLSVSTGITAPGAVAADDVAAGAAAFTGTARTPVVPCTSKREAMGHCGGTWQGDFTGTFEGVHGRADGGRSTWAVEIDAPGEATLVYLAPAPENACAAAVVRGRAVFSGGLDQVFGVSGKTAPLPRAVTGIRMSLDFEWHRTRVTGPLVVTRLWMELDVYGVGPVTVIDDGRTVSAADAVAAFAPNDVGACISSNPEVLDGMLRGTLSSIAVSAN